MRRRRDGHSLIELVVTGVLLSVVSVALATVLFLSARAVQNNGQAMQADALAREILETGRSLPLGKLSPEALGLPRQERRDGTTYQASGEIFTVTGADPNLVKGVRVHIAWSCQGRPQETVQELLVTALAH